MTRSQAAQVLAAFLEIHEEYSWRGAGDPSEMSEKESAFKEAKEKMITLLTEAEAP